MKTDGRAGGWMDKI